MLEVKNKFLRDAKAGNYKHGILGFIKSILYEYTKLSLTRKLVQSDVELLDISFYQSTANFSKMKENGINGVIIRAGQNKWADTHAPIFMADAKLANMPIGSYWFYDSRVSPKDQAEKWKSVLGDIETPLYCWADYEETYKGTYSGWNNFYNFLEACKQKMPNRKFGIYTGYYYWLEHSPTNQASLNYFAQYPLWLAWYTTDPTYVKIPRPWTKVTFWQNSSNGNGTKLGVGSLDVDTDFFIGTKDEFNKLFSLDTSTPSVPPTIPEPPTPPITPTEPPVEPKVTKAVYRIIWDDENPDLNYKSRTESKGWGSLKAPPAVYRFYPKMVANPNKKQGDFRVNISAWKPFFLTLNGGDIQDFKYWTGKQRAQFNFTGWPQLAYLVLSGNLVKGEVVNGWLKFETLKPTDLDKAKGKTYRTDPYLIHTFTCVKYDKKLKKTIHILSTGTPRGEIFYPLISKEGYGYIPLKYVKFVRYITE